MKEMIKNFVYCHPNLTRRCVQFINMLSFNRVSKGKNNVKINGLLKHSKIIVVGTGNTIIVDDYARLQKCAITVSGNNNTIRIGKKTYLEYGELYIEDDNGEISIGENTIVSAHFHFAEIEGTKIRIGSNCLFSAGASIRTGDSHTIMDATSRKRINPSSDVIIDNHVWLGNGATVLKGCHISENCVVGTNSVLTKSMNAGCVAAGNPAKIIRENIDWSAIRTKINI